MSDSSKRWAPPRSFVEGVGVFAGQLVAIVIATWPLGARLATHAPSNLGDPLLNAYLLGWGGHAIIRDPLRVFAATMFDPARLTLALTENLLGMSLPFAPLFWLTDDALLVLNVALLAAAAVAGLGAFLLVRELTGSKPVAFVCALAYTVMPVRLAQIDHFQVFTVYALPFVLLLLLRLGSTDDGTWAVRRRILALALVVAAGTWASLIGSVLIGLVVGAWILWVLMHRPVQWRVLGRGAVGVGLGLVLSVPVLVPYFVLRAEYPDYRHPEEVARTFSASPGSYLSPPPGGSVVRRSYAELAQQFGQDDGYWEKRLFPGFWLLVAGFGGLVLAIRGRRHHELGNVPLFGALLVVVGFVFSLGPRWAGEEDGVPLPFMVLSAFGNLTRVPARLGAVVPLGLLLLAGWGLARIPSRWRTVAVAASVVVIVLEMAPTSVPTVRAPEITAAHRSIADRGGAVLALPTTEFDPTGAVRGESLPLDLQHLYLSTGHFRRMINGSGSYHPPSYWEVVTAVQTFPTDGAFEVFRRRDIRTVVVQTALLPGTRWAAVVERMDAWPGVRRIDQAEGVIVYDVTEAAGTAPA